MIEDCKKMGLPEPKFKEYSSGLAVIFSFKEPIGGNKTVKHIELTTRQREILKLTGKEHRTIVLR